MLVVAPEGRHFIRELTSLMFIVLQTTFGNTAIVFHNGSNIFMDDWKVSAFLQSPAGSSLDPPFSTLVVVTEARRLCPAVNTAGNTMRAGCVAAIAWDSTLLPA